MNLPVAQRLAARLVAQMAPHADQVRVAGSVRRLKPEPGDVELVAVPKLSTRVESDGLFDTRTVTVNHLHEWAVSSDVQWIKPGVSEIAPWTPKADGKYWRGMVEGIKLDLFLCRPENFGLILAIRTGPSQWSHRLVTPVAHGGLMPFGCRVQDGVFWRDGQAVPVPDEDTLFRLIGQRWVEPKERL